MTKGESPKLFWHELGELLQEIFQLKEIALQTSGGNVDANYALVGYFFNLNIFQENIVNLIRALAFSEDLPLLTTEDTEKMRADQQPLDSSNISVFNDLVKAHKALDEKIRVVFTAYQDVLQNNKPLEVWARVAERYWGYANSQLDLSREKYYGDWKKSLELHEK